MVLTCDKGLGKLLGLLLLLLKGSGQCLGLGHCWHHLLKMGGVNEKSGKIEVEARKGMGGLREPTWGEYAAAYWLYMSRRGFPVPPCRPASCMMFGLSPYAAC